MLTRSKTWFQRSVLFKLQTGIRGVRSACARRAIKVCLKTPTRCFKDNGRACMCFDERVCTRAPRRRIQGLSETLVKGDFDNPSGNEASHHTPPSPSYLISPFLSIFVHQLPFSSQTRMHRCRRVKLALGGTRGHKRLLSPAESEETAPPPLSNSKIFDLPFKYFHRCALDYPPAAFHR